MNALIEEMARRAALDHGAGLYDLEMKPTQKGTVLCVYITRLEGVSLDLCAQVSRSLSAALDAADPINGQYFLEVSSPGLERRLTKKSHWLSAIGQQVKVVTSNGEITGTLLELGNDDALIQTGEEEPLRLPLNEVKKAKTVLVP